jgi:hypothetical protein
VGLLLDEQLNYASEVEEDSTRLWGRCDSRYAKTELRLCDSPQKSQEAELAIRTMIIKESSASHAIDLASEAFQWACRDGFKTIVSTLGPWGGRPDV